MGEAQVPQMPPEHKAGIWPLTCTWASDLACPWRGEGRTGKGWRDSKERDWGKWGREGGSRCAMPAGDWLRRVGYTQFPSQHVPEQKTSLAKFPKLLTFQVFQSLVWRRWSDPASAPQPCGPLDAGRNTPSRRGLAGTQRCCTCCTCTSLLEGFSVMWGIPEKRHSRQRIPNQRELNTYFLPFPFMDKGNKHHLSMAPCLE